ncbi:MAG: alpha/beta fold hydrolase [Maritimibacter sp.]
MMDWTSKGRMTAAGKGLEYACFGPAPEKESPVIVMLHEGLGSSGLWRDVPQKISDATGLGVITYSRAGYGFSDPATLPRPLDYMTREAVDVLPDVLNEIGAKRVILLGHSDGATIAAEYAGRVSDMRVRGLILIAPHFFTEPMGLAEIAAAKVAFETTDLPAKMAKHHADAEATFRGWNEAWLAPGFVDWHVGEAIDHWRIPCLALQGAQDQYGTLAQIREIESRAYVPVETCIIEGARHAPHLEAQDETLAAIADFCARLVRIESEVVVPA